MPILDPPEIRGRQLVQQLTEDLSWLEAHARSRPEQAQQAARLRLAAALARNCIGPFLEDGPTLPLHVVVVGGAGAGKSTITNFLIGTTTAEANPQAGFTRHPIAYAGPSNQSWSGHLGFLGPLERLTEPRPSNVDEDVYQVRKVTQTDKGSLLERMVVWDCPDMTTWQAERYLLRLVEALALADVVVYVASDERYNDEMPTQFLQLILQAGKPVVTCLTKMKPENAQALVDHYRREVVARIPECTRVAASLAVPQLSLAELADPVRGAARYREPLVQQVSWWGERPAEARKGGVRGGMEYLNRFEDSLLAVARDDLNALRGWRELVEKGRDEFANRYYKEYLSGNNFPRFNEALVRLLQLLELPGIGQYVSMVLWAVRTPYRLARGAISRLISRPPTAQIPEEPILEAALQGWLDLLRREAARRKAEHPLWAHAEKGFEGPLPEQVKTLFQKCIRDFHVGLLQEVESTARSIYEDLEKRPVALNALRGVKFTLEAGSIGGMLIAGGLSPWDLLVLLVTPLIQEIAELLGKQYVDTQKEIARQRQQELLEKTVARPLAEFLAQWPATGGSTFERLELALRRIPATVRSLAAEVDTRMGT